MFGDLIAGTSVSLLALAFAFAGAGVMRLVTWDAKRARWQREFGGGWRALQRDRIARAVQPPLPALSGVFLPRRECAEQGWQNVQRNRVARRRYGRASW